MICALDVGFPEFFLRKKKSCRSLDAHCAGYPARLLVCDSAQRQERLLTSLLRKLLSLFPEGLYVRAPSFSLGKSSSEMQPCLIENIALDLFNV